MTLAYWLGQFTLTAAFYAFAMFLWPSVVFSRFLHGRSRTFRFAFCTAGMILLTNLVVLGMGLIPHTLHEWVVAVLFYGAFGIQVVRLGRKRIHSAAKLMHRALRGTLGKKSLFLDFIEFLRGCIRGLRKKCHEFFKGHAVEYGILIVLCVYGILYFSWNAFQMRFYGFGDMYVHHAWIDGLQQGTIFSAGIYPEGMHTFVYLLHCISGVRVYSLLLFLGGIHSVLLLVSLWIFLRELFHWKYTALAVVLLFLMLEQTSVVDIYAMSRIQWTIPQEFALFTMFLCGTFLVRWLRGNPRGRENRFPFWLSVAASFAIHFYVTIMAVVICIGIVIANLGSFFRKGRWRRIILTALLAVLIPLLPMAGAYAEGHPLQGSLTWAMGVMQGKNSDSLVDDSEDAESDQSDSRNTLSETAGAEKSSQKTNSGNSTNAGRLQGEEKSSASTNHGIHGITITLREKSRHLISVVRQRAETLEKFGFKEVFGDQLGRIYDIGTVGVFVISVMIQTILAIVGVFRRRHCPDLLRGGLAVSTAACLFMLDYAAHKFGLPQIIAGARVLVPARMMILASLLTGPDFLYFGISSVLRKIWKSLRRKSSSQSEGSETGRKEKIYDVQFVQPVAGIIFLGLLCVLIAFTGLYHGYLYYEQSRYTEAVETTNHIIHQMNPKTYTIVSTTDELYQVKQYGYHEELLTLVKTAESYVGYSLPTEYIYVYVEKKPLMYGQTHFGRGPAWLAINGKNTRPYRYYHLDFSEGNHSVAGEISEKAGNKKLKNEIGDSRAASELKNRVILESKAMKWVQEFQRCYPHDIGVYYEDDRFICYKIKQDPQIPYRMGFFANK